MKTTSSTAAPSISVTPVALEGNPEYNGHKGAFKIADTETGLRGYIAIHNTNRGPAIGGTRCWRYATEEEALRDVLRLSRAMTYKCAIADVPYGGAKGVIILTKETPKSDELLAAYARAVGLLPEPFYTGEDVGLDRHDLEVLEKHLGTMVGHPEISGMPAEWASLSVFYAMEEALSAVSGTSSFEGKTVAVKGLGGVGMGLCDLLAEKGARLKGADVNPERVALARKRHPDIEIVPSERIHAERADIYSPCALGDEFNEKTVSELSSKIVCGGANNQLHAAEDGKRLHERGILYIPDYLANAGGLISVSDELHEGGWSRDRVAEKTLDIKKTVREVIDRSRVEDAPTSVVTDEIAENRFLSR